MAREEEIIKYLQTNLLNPILESTNASEKLKKATRGTLIRLNQQDARGMIQYFWNEIVGTSEKIPKYGRLMKGEGFTHFEEIANEFGSKFKDL